MLFLFLFRPIFYLINKLTIFLYGIQTGNKFHMDGKLYYMGLKGKVVIGDNFFGCSGYHANPISHANKLIMSVMDDGKILIGNNVGISNSCIISRGINTTITIEDNVRIGNGCCIYDSDFHPLDFKDRMEHNVDKIASKSVLIKEGAFIGAQSIILKGATIGKYSIVGAGSVVTKEIPDGEIWAGNPAKFIRKIN